MLQEFESKKEALQQRFNDFFADLERKKKDFQAEQEILLEKLNNEYEHLLNDGTTTTSTTTTHDDDDDAGVGRDIDTRTDKPSSLEQEEGKKKQTATSLYSFSEDAEGGEKDGEKDMETPRVKEEPSARVACRRAMAIKSLLSPLQVDGEDSRLPVPCPFMVAQEKLAGLHKACVKRKRVRVYQID